MYMEEHTKKYELIDVGDDYIGNRKVYRIKALRDFESAKKGDVGGYVESEENLSHSGRCWVYDNAYVVDKARVYEDATIRGSVWIFDNAEVFGRASISGQARVFHYAKVYDHAKVFDNAQIYHSSEVYRHGVVHGNARMKRMKATKPVTVIDNSDIIITIADNRFHVYQSKVYISDDYPIKYRKLLTFLESLDE
ncbi:MAG: hypothetical protein ACVCEJ_05925 [Candidatus Izemoplasmataceae bacterium]